MQGFDYRAATEEEILARAAMLEGMRVGDIPGASLTSADARRGKGEVGLAVETFFGIPPNPISEADFPGSGIELKVVPLFESTRGLRVKERTFISHIDYEALARESWRTASVRKKLHILFVFYEHFRETSKREFPIHSIALWRPAGEVEKQIESDWLAVQAKVLDGRAHELSEADGRILGPATKGSDSRVLKRQPFNSILAPSRAFALKPSFTFSLYVEPVGRSLDARELAENASLVELRHRLRRFVGKSIDAAADTLGRRRSEGKGYAGYVIRDAVRASSPLEGHDFDVIGPTVKMARVDRQLLPYEAVSFPAFRHMDLETETWEDSELLSLIEHMLIVPVVADTKETPAGRCVIDEPVYWRPSAEQIALVRAEWTDFRDRIARGEAGRLPTAAATRAIHVRPHGRNKDDLDPTPGGGFQPKKSFWLNRSFVQEILRGSTRTTPK